MPTPTTPTSGSSFAAVRRYRSLDFRLTAFRRIDPATSCWLWTRSTNAKGYGIIGHNAKTYLVPRIAMMLYRGFNLRSSLNVLHHCDTPQCFNPDHLYLGTQKENVADAKRRGRWRQGRGEANSHAKLTANEVLMIRSRYKRGAAIRALAKRFRVSHDTISSICKKETWSHLPDPPQAAA